jgi:hypothetical protein
VYGEGYGFGGPGGQTADATPDETDVADFTKNLVKQKRQESPKLIFTFLEGDVDSGKAALRGAAGADPYKKVSTTIQSAQNEVSLREYWIPKADNTGGTFMVFTDHFGSKEKNDGFDTTSIKVTTTPTGGATAASGLHLDQVVTMEFLAGYTGLSTGVTGITGNVSNLDGLSALLSYSVQSNMYPGYVRYSNRDYLYAGQGSAAFTSTEYARKREVGVLDTTTDILQLGAERDGQYSIFNIRNPAQLTTNQIINNSSQLGSSGDTVADAVLIKTDTSGLNAFDVDLIEDSDYSYTPSTGTGSIASAIATTELQFQPTISPSPDLITPDRIKVTIDFAASGAAGSAWEQFGPLYMGLIPDDGGNFSMDHMFNSCLTNEYFGTIWPTAGGSIPMVPYPVTFENQISFYIPFSDWSLNSNSPWKLGMMLRTSGNFQDPDAENFLTTTDILRVTNFEIKFEEVYNPADTEARIQETEILPSTSEPANLSTVHRNIDHFYSIHATGAAGAETSSIRFKRINSEFALVDFNITVKVDNPVLSGGTADDTFSYIDFCSPRFTQYLRFVYVPDEDFDSELTFRQDFAQDTFGNGMWLTNWSTYNQWYPGTAIVGNSSTTRDYYGSNVAPAVTTIGTNLRNSSTDGSPFFTDQTTASSFRTWNGNYLDILSYYIFSGAGANTFRENSIYKAEGNDTPLTNVYSTFTLFPTNGERGSGMYSAFGSDRRILQIAKAMFNQVGAATETGTKQLGFVQFLGAAYSIWHNHTYMRNKNVQWRMVPAKSYIYEPGAAPTTGMPNNTFVLEVQFSDPMLHVDTPFGQRAFLGTAGTNDTDRFYQYLTISGQSIVKYAETAADVGR